ncbi:MAG: hypothetical protein IPM38_19205 [Ignavibacteria bacterium]|nr:hypothetical protein [Ignavibacteria bacterium]
MGHAGSQDWEIALNDPEILSNHGKFPVILSMTCYTGKVGEPNFRSFGERFMNMNNTGAVSFFATSGWGFVYSGSLINSLFYKSFAKDTVRRVGDMVSYAMNSIKSDSLSFSIRHTVNCYTLMGDPALKLQLPAYPEFTISENDYKLSNKSPSVNEPINLKVFPQNFGLNSDSATMRLIVTKNFNKYYFKDTVLRNFSSKDSISYNFKLNSKGRYEAKVILDLYNSSPDENKNDNTLIFEIDVKNVSFVPYKPVHNSVVRKDSVEYVGMNPFIKKNEKSIILLLQTDTSANFNSR